MGLILGHRKWAVDGWCRLGGPKILSPFSISLHDDDFTAGIKQLIQEFPPKRIEATALFIVALPGILCNVDVQVM